MPEYFDDAEDIMEQDLIIIEDGLRSMAESTLKMCDDTVNTGEHYELPVLYADLSLLAYLLHEAHDVCNSLLGNNFDY